MKTVDLSNFYNKDTYNPGNKLKILLWFIFGNIFVNTYFPWPSFIKLSVIQLFGAKIGKGVVIKPKVNIKYPWFLSVDDFSWIGEGVWIDNLVDIKIGKNVCLSQGCFLLTGNHNFKKSTFNLITNKIILEEGVWIGAKAIVGPGVTCFSHAILSIGSVTSKNLEPYGIYRGNPAILVQKREILD